MSRQQNVWPSNFLNALQPEQFKQKINYNIAHTCFKYFSETSMPASTEKTVSHP